VLGRLDLGALRELGWRPEVELEDGMRRTLEWLSSLA
jgi:nucleoside-diphosphate-sugar epimerase